MHLNAMILGLGSHAASWKLPHIDPLANTRLSYWIDIAKKAEDGGFDALFLDDSLAVQPETTNRLAGALDSNIILSALAATTHHIGLIGTASTTFDHAYHIARRFASLDHISNGRVGWNIVISSSLCEAKNFGRDVLAPNDELYARAEDVLKAVIALWQSWHPSARIADKTNGNYLDDNYVKNTNYVGSYIRTIGPLSVPYSPQGKPLLVHGSISDTGCEFACRYANIIFTAQSNFKDAQDFYIDVKNKCHKAGRNNDEVLIFPGIVPIIANTRQEAQQKLEYLNQLALPNTGMRRLSNILNINLEKFDIHKPLPSAILQSADDINLTSQARLILNEARRNHLTLKEMAERFICSHGNFMAVGTPKDIADIMQEWFESGAADGFNVLFATLPNDISLFNETVMPILKDRLLRKTRVEKEFLKTRFGIPLKSALSQQQIHA